MYRDDLAFIHEVGYGDHARNAAPILVAALQSGGLGRGLVVDLGCGSGSLSAPVVAAGYDLLGYDFSRSMIALARKQVPRGQFRVGSLLSAELPPCVGVAAVGECLNYLFDPSNTENAQARLFRRIHAALSPGGVFLFDGAEPGRVPGGARRDFREGDGWAVLVAMDEDRQQRLLTRQITSFRQVGKLYRRDHEVHRLRLFNRAALARELRAIGFRVRILRAYGSMRFPPGYISFLARKKPAPSHLAATTP